MQVFDVGTNVLPIGLLGYDQVTISSVAGDTLYYSTSNQVTPAAHQGTIVAGGSQVFTGTTNIVSAGRTTVSVEWAGQAPDSSSDFVEATAVDGGSSANEVATFGIVTGGATSGVVLMAIIDGGDGVITKPVGAIDGGMAV